MRTGSPAMCSQLREVPSMGPSLIFAYLVREYLRRSPQSLTKLGLSVRRKARGWYRQIDGAAERRLTRHSGSDGRDPQCELFSGIGEACRFDCPNLVLQAGLGPNCLGSHRHERDASEILA